METKKISVIMPSYLGEYEGCASNRPDKLKRAIKSFLDNDYPNKELIIVADGCEETINLVKEAYDSQINSDLINPLIRLESVKRKGVLSGSVRDKGLSMAIGDIVCYLDSDDMFEKNHLTNICKNFNPNQYDWVYFADYLFHEGKKIVRPAHFVQGEIGTSCIAHKNIRKTFFWDKKISWKGFDGYNHDFAFIMNLVEKFPKHKKIYGGGYVVCHSHSTDC